MKLVKYLYSMQSEKSNIFPRFKYLLTIPDLLISLRSKFLDEISQDKIAFWITLWEKSFVLCFNYMSLACGHVCCTTK